MSDLNLRSEEFWPVGTRRRLREYTQADAQRLIEACREDDRIGDAQVEAYERSIALRDRGRRREKRANECGAIAVVCFGLIALMLLPTIAGKWPVETLIGAAAIGIVVSVSKAASRNNPEW